MAAKKKAKKSAPVKKSNVKKAKPTVKKAAGKKAAPAKKTAAAKKTQVKSAVPAPKAQAKSIAKSDVSITPLDDRLVIVPEVMPEKTAGGLYIPTTVEQKQLRGTVLAKGRGKRNKKGQLRPLDVSVGDEVMFAEYAGTKISMGGQDVLILREEDVLAIVT